MSERNFSQLGDMIARAAKTLPSQSPLHAFVHHNTLHAYEHLRFKDALRTASKELGAEPFMSEQNYLDAANRGRIQIADIEHVLESELSDLDQPICVGTPTRRAVLLWRLNTLFNVPNRQSINWWLYEKGYIHSPHKLAGSAANSPASSLFSQSKREYLPGDLESLWFNLENAAPLKSRQFINVRPRDFIFERYRFDIDDLVKPFLIRYAAAYLDQGVGSLAQPDKSDGFLVSFRNMYLLGNLPLPSWLKGITAECQRQSQKGSGALDVIADVLDYFGVDCEYQQSYLTESLKMLKGWAGMFLQYEKQPEKVPVSAYPARLTDFLAVQLMLEKLAVVNTCTSLGYKNELYTAYLRENGTEITDCRKSVQDVYEAFITAQAFDLPATVFAKPENAKKWVNEIGRFDSFERRYLLQLAYERRHRHHVLDGLLEHQQFEQLSQTSDEVLFQAVFCMDEREESTRRHLEEVTPAVRTYGFAGFFGVAMQYQGLEDVSSRPLCPVNRVPEHFVSEVALDATEASRYQKYRKLQGLYSKQVIDHEAVISIGPFWSLLMGIAKTPSLIFRSLVPRLTEKTKKRLGAFAPVRPRTRLKLFREETDARVDGLFQGYSIEEAATAVHSTLAAMGMTSDFAPCVVIVGHGSSSLNNPHEAAHDCGATGGGRGGPNARAFAAMANHEEVRSTVAKKGINIPSETWFVGAYHNTCDDSMEYYDQDLVPDSHKAVIQDIKDAFRQACKMDALERCRKFEEVPIDVTADEAFDYVYQHSIDLAQPRPEYGHATNAICIIGRRQKTRGLFLDRRSFLISYDPEQDPDKSILAGILESAGPVGAGINLEYYFSFIDPVVYGCGTKLPHNISGLIGVMEGHSSDLRTGLPWQMVEIHEPVRLLTIVEATPEELTRIAQEREVVGNLVGNEWIQLVSMHPQTGEMSIFSGGEFVKHTPERMGFPVSENSENLFRGTAAYLGLAHINARTEGEINV